MHVYGYVWSYLPGHGVWVIYCIKNRRYVPQLCIIYFDSYIHTYIHAYTHLNLLLPAAQQQQHSHFTNGASVYDHVYISACVLMCVDVCVGLCNLYTFHLSTIFYAKDPLRWHCIQISLFAYLLLGLHEMSARLFVFIRVCVCVCVCSCFIKHFWALQYFSHLRTHKLRLMTCGAHKSTYAYI